MILPRFAKYLQLIRLFFYKDKSQKALNNDLSIISEWAFKWKMQFNPDPNEQANEVYISRNPNTDDYIHIKLDDSPVQLREDI